MRRPSAGSRVRVRVRVRVRDMVRFCNAVILELGLEFGLGLGWA